MRQESDERRCDWLRGGRKVRKDPEVAAMMRAGLILLRKGATILPYFGSFSIGITGSSFTKGDEFVPQFLTVSYHLAEETRNRDHVRNR